MITRFRSWWQKANKPLLVIETIGLLTAVVVIVLGYWLKWGWTGFPSKTLWDWLQLLFIPIMLAIGGFWLNQIQKSREERITEQHGQIERELAEDNQREVALQAYIDKMSELLLEKQLRKSSEEEEVRKIARIRTLTVLLHVDGVRKRRVLQFLYESGLVEKEKPIISLDGADLRGAALRGANLNKTNLFGTRLSEAFIDVEPTVMSELFNKIDRFTDDLFGQHNVYLDEGARSRDDLGGVALSGANLKKADLFGANLGGADLSRANLDGANLSEAYLSKANLSEAYLVGADLYRTDLGGADLSGAFLFQADLSHANLRDAKVIAEKLDVVKSLKYAIMPDGSTHPK